MANSSLRHFGAAMYTKLISESYENDMKPAAPEAFVGMGVLFRGGLPRIIRIGAKGGMGLTDPHL